MPETCHVDDEYSEHVENPRYQLLSGITHVTPEKKGLHYKPRSETYYTKRRIH